MCNILQAVDCVLYSTDCRLCVIFYRLQAMCNILQAVGCVYFSTGCMLCVAVYRL